MSVPDRRYGEKAAEKHFTLDSFVFQQKRAPGKPLGSAIEASKIAGHSDLEMTGEYTCVSPERQNELTRRIQRQLRQAGRKNGKEKVVNSRVPTSGVPDRSPNLEPPVAANPQPYTTSLALIPPHDYTAPIA